MRESKYQKRLREEYEKEGAITLKLDPRSSMIEKGFPDLLVILPNGRVRFIEAKAERGVVSPAQQHQHSRLRAMGHDVLVVRPESTHG